VKAKKKSRKANRLTTTDREKLSKLKCDMGTLRSAVRALCDSFLIKPKGNYADDVLACLRIRESVDPRPSVTMAHFLDWIGWMVTDSVNDWSFPCHHPELAQKFILLFKKDVDARAVFELFARGKASVDAINIMRAKATESFSETQQSRIVMLGTKATP
jgi:hypothetical protein